MKWLISIVIVLISAGLLIALPFKNKTTLTWDAPTTNVDGSPITDLGGYKVYRSQVSGAYTDANAKDVGNVTSINIQATLGELKGLHCFVATAYDVAGNESDLSNETCSEFVIKKSSPTNLR